ncbi:MAG: hypothetical protein AABX93_03330 [Nanoarchaeota archaeon]
MNLETLTNIVNDYDPALLGFLAISAPTITGLVAYSCAKQIYYDFKNRNKKLIQQEISQNYDSGYSL